MSIYGLIEKKKKDQKKKERAKIAKIAGATAILGTAVGAATGILFAPKSGKETRDDLANKTKEASTKIAEKGNELKNNINSKVSEHKDDLKVAKGKISEYLANRKVKSSEEEIILEENIETDNDNIESEDLTEKKDMNANE